MKLIKLTCILMLAISMMHCSKSESEPKVVGEEIVRLQFNQTYCPDLWSSQGENTDEELILSIKTFFETEHQIYLEPVTISIDSSIIQICASCNCPNGKVITAITDQFYDELAAEGFFTP